MGSGVEKFTMEYYKTNQMAHGFLETILKRPKNEKAFLLIPVGFPHKSAKVPVLKKKPFEGCGYFQDLIP